VVVLPLPVGPVTRIIPYGFMISRSKCASVSSEKPSDPRFTTIDERSRMRGTTLSP